MKKVKEFLKNKKNDCFTFKDLKCIFKAMKLEQIKKMVNELLEEDFFIESVECFYIKENLKTGVIDIKSKGFGFFSDEIEEVFVRESDTLDAMSGDTVLVHIDKIGKRLKEGHVVKVLERKVKNLVGTIKLEGKKIKFIPDRLELKDFNIVVDKAGIIDLEDDMKVMVQITKYKYKMLFVKLVEKLGLIDDKGIDILSIIKEKGINYEFDYKVMKEANSIDPNVTFSFERRDLRDKLIFTIDGNDAKDFDDAVSLTYENGIYELGVHIADVSYYVKENKELDKEAFKRGTSIYLVDRVIPMLPEILSNGVCSLVYGEDRLTISCVMKIDSKGKIIDYEIFESVINSKKRMTYDEVNETILNQKGDFLDTINLMNELNKILTNKRKDRGAINFLEKEAVIILDDNGKAVDIRLRERKDSEKLIESFMIQANEVVAEAINSLELPFINRVHELPDEEKMSEFLEEVKKLGYKGKLGKEITPMDCQKILEYFENNRMISDRLLRSMAKAKYNMNNYGHFGLASSNYCHFTSPIRRYPDLIVHRIIKDYLINHNLKRVEYWEEHLEEISNHSSVRERKAIEIEREVVDMKKAEYMENYIGEEYDGVISGIINNGFFVELDNTVEGFVYEADCTRVIGDRVRVKVESSSKEKRQVDFLEIR